MRGGWLFLKFSVLVANPKKLRSTFLHGGQSYSWSAEQGENTNKKSDIKGQRSRVPS